MTESEPNYSPLEKHMLGLSMVHPTYLFVKPSLSSRFSRWTLMLAEFDILYVTSKCVKGRDVAENLSDLPIKFDEEKDFSFLNKGVMEIAEDKWKMYFNGAAIKVILLLGLQNDLGS